ncbi:hypothetical protein AaE_008117 [Aphanomyces astaci]|uniref:Chromo domain-containing protein n=1 Tax=Aphanomyces astaci TaxID=112090 RepID=A0A6A5A8K7_APHAT|nr:hypothetical protein AaE_008117 [Aphanomyces astaci]
MEGDYVLWSRVDENSYYPKLSVTWIGPFQVKECLPYSCVIEHVINGNEREAHHSDRNQSAVLTVGAIQAAGLNPGTNRCELIVQWKAHETIKSSWEQFLVMYGEVPLLVKQFVDALQTEGQCRALLEALASL